MLLYLIAIGGEKQPKSNLVLVWVCRGTMVPPACPKLSQLAMADEMGKEGEESHLKR